MGAAALAYQLVPLEAEEPSGPAPRMVSAGELLAKRQDRQAQELRQHQVLLAQMETGERRCQQMLADLEGLPLDSPHYLPCLRVRRAAEAAAATYHHLITERTKP